MVFKFSITANKYHSLKHDSWPIATARHQREDFDIQGTEEDIHTKSRSKPLPPHRQIAFVGNVDICTVLKASSFTV